MKAVFAPAVSLIAALITASAFAQAPAASAPAAAPATSAPAAAPAPAAPAKLDLAKGAAVYAQVCLSCHGTDGNSTTPVNPKLAQQHPEYLVKQLQEFKSGKRKNAVMQGFSAALSEQDMRNIAYYLAGKTQKAGFAKDKALVATGERIWRGGLSDRQIAACAGCHSPSGAGIPAQYPRLAGQHADYVESSLRAYRDGSRANSAQMTGVAAKMTDKEIKAVSDYVAGLR
jgi:cytochrome c553